METFEPGATVDRYIQAPAPFNSKARCLTRPSHKMCRLSLSAVMSIARCNKAAPSASDRTNIQESLHIAQK